MPLLSPGYIKLWHTIQNAILSDLVLMRPQPFPARTGLDLLSFRVLAGNRQQLRRSSLYYVAEAVHQWILSHIDFLLTWKICPSDLKLISFYHPQHSLGMISSPMEGWLVLNIFVAWLAWLSSTGEVQLVNY